MKENRNRNIGAGCLLLAGGFIGGTILERGMENVLQKFLKEPRSITIGGNPSLLATLTPVCDLQKAAGTLPVCGAFPTETPVPTARVTATVPAKPIVTRTPAPVKETFLTCDDIKNGGPVKVSRPMPEVSVSSLKALWPNDKVQNVFGSAIHSLVTQEPGAIVFSPDAKGNPDLQKVVQDGYAFWI